MVVKMTIPQWFAPQPPAAAFATHPRKSPLAQNERWPLLQMPHASYGSFNTIALGAFCKRWPPLAPICRCAIERPIPSHSFQSLVQQACTAPSSTHCTSQRYSSAGASPSITTATILTYGWSTTGKAASAQHRASRYELGLRVAQIAS